MCETWLRFIDSNMISSQIKTSIPTYRGLTQLCGETFPLPGNRWRSLWPWPPVSNHVVESRATMHAVPTIPFLTFTANFFQFRPSIKWWNVLGARFEFACWMHVICYIIAKMGGSVSQTLIHLTIFSKSRLNDVQKILLTTIIVIFRQLWMPRETLDNGLFSKSDWPKFCFVSNFTEADS